MACRLGYIKGSCLDNLGRGIQDAQCDMWSLLFIGGVRVGSCGTHIVFGCIHLTIHWGLFIHCPLVVIVPNVGGWVQIPICTLIIVI